MKRGRFVELAAKYGYTKDGEPIDSVAGDPAYAGASLRRGGDGRDRGGGPQDARAGAGGGRFEMLGTTDAAAVREERHMGLTFRDLEGIFAALDINEDGSITHAEFVRGLRRDQGIAKKLGE